MPRPRCDCGLARRRSPPPYWGTGRKEPLTPSTRGAPLRTPLTAGEGACGPSLRRMQLRCGLGQGASGALFPKGHGRGRHLFQALLLTREPAAIPVAFGHALRDARRSSTAASPQRLGNQFSGIANSRGQGLATLVTAPASGPSLGLPSSCRVPHSACTVRETFQENS